MTPNYVGYECLAAELNGQHDAARAIRALAAALPRPAPETTPELPWTHTVLCACGRSHRVPPHTVASKCPGRQERGCGSDHLWTADHGWVTIGLRPRNVACPCGHAFGVRPDQRRCTCYRCDARFDYDDAGWTPLSPRAVTLETNGKPVIEGQPRLAV